MKQGYHIDDDVTIPAFQRWLKTARPGDKFTYHRGHLASDREDATMIPGLGLTHVFYDPFHILGQMAWEAYLSGAVVLAQKKLPDGQGFEYIAFKRDQRRK